MPKQKSLYDYDERYQRVFTAGGLNWNYPSPGPALSRFLDRQPRHLDCIEFGCGEGYQARFMASRGHPVTAIDLSPAAIAKAVRDTPAGCNVTFLVGDMTDAASLHLPEAAFDLAIDIGCLHMMTEDEDRTSYLELVCRVLKPGGRFYLQEGLREGEVPPGTVATAGTTGLGLSDPPRTIMTADGVREVRLPILPARMLSLEEYLAELTRHGLNIVSAERTTGYQDPSSAPLTGINCDHEAVIVAAKPA
jgi:SAM-dependent methyltransferase